MPFKTRLLNASLFLLPTLLNIVSFITIICIKILLLPLYSYIDNPGIGTHIWEGLYLGLALLKEELSFYLFLIRVQLRIKCSQYGDNTSLLLHYLNPSK